MGANGETDINTQGGSNGRFGMTSTGALKICDNCCGCIDCTHCSGCASGDEPGCPTASCCAPNAIQVVVSGVTPLFDTCILYCDGTPALNYGGGLFGNYKVQGTTNVNRTVTMTQFAPLGPPSCTWRATIDVDWTIEEWRAGTPPNNCNFILSTTAAGTLTYSLVRLSATEWQFKIFTNGGLVAPFAGDDLVICATTGTCIGAATAAICNTVPNISNGVANSGETGYRIGTPMGTGGLFMAYGGSASFTVCP